MYKVLEVLESPTIELKYFIHPKVLTTTIGIGFDLEKASEDEKQAVYRALGFDVDGAWPGTKPAVGSPLHTEQQYLKRILDLVAAGTHTQPPFDAIMKERAEEGPITIRSLAAPGITS